MDRDTPSSRNREAAVSRARLLALLAWALSWGSLAASLALCASAAAFALFLAQAQIDKGTFYTGPVGAVFGVYLLLGIALSAGSALLALASGAAGATRERKGPKPRPWAAWLASNALFAAALAGGSLLVNARLG